MRHLIILFTATAAGMIAAIFAGARAELDHSANGYASAPNADKDKKGGRDD